MAALAMRDRPFQRFTRISLPTSRIEQQDRRPIIIINIIIIISRQRE